MFNDSKQTHRLMILSVVAQAITMCAAMAGPQFDFFNRNPVMQQKVVDTASSTVVPSNMITTEIYVDANIARAVREAGLDLNTEVVRALTNFRNLYGNRRPPFPGFTAATNSRELVRVNVNREVMNWYYSLGLHQVVYYDLALSQIIPS